MTIENTLDICIHSGLKGWDLVEKTQVLVSQNMEYSYSNTFDSPKKAFKKGRGYCWQQSSMLNTLLQKLGFNSYMVYSTKCLIPTKLYHGVEIPSHYSGHVWCRVKINDEIKDVCPSKPNNKPGTIHFKVISPVKKWNQWICACSYLGSAYINYKRLRFFKALQKTSNYLHKG